MFIKILTFAAIAVSSTQAAAETLYCRFHQSGQAISLLKWNDKARTIETVTDGNRKHRYYKDVDVFRGLAPYDDGRPARQVTKLDKKQMKRGFSLVVFGDVPAIHIRKRTSSHWEDQCLLYPYEAYWGLIPGRLEAMNWLDNVTMKDAGPKGVCWTKKEGVKDRASCGGGNGGGGNRDNNKGKGKDCKNHGGKGGEKSSTRGKNN